MTDSEQITPAPGKEVATLAGGCFWCLEAVYDQMKGVESVESGYMGGHTPNPTYTAVCSGATGHAEVVRVPFDPKVASPITWMVAIARNRSLDLIRKKGETSIEDEPAAMEAAGEEPNPLARREMTEELRRLLGCLGQLDEDRRRMVLLAYYSGWSRDQLAAKFDAPANTIKTWLRRSLLEIRECLGS